MSKINILFFDILDSTNTYAKNNAFTLPLPSLIIANEQTQGRGRRGNSFFSPKNTGLYMTLVIKEPEKTELITPAAAVAVCRVLERKGIHPSIKWVNDLFINGKKFCGILTERLSANNKTVIATGIGINLTTTDFPEELNNACSLNLITDKTALAKEISSEIIAQINSTDTVTEYKNRLFIIGKEISYSYNGKLFSGIAADINEYCNLKVNHSDGTSRILSSGEISIKI